MSNSSESYNGWPNYETWAVNLWLGEALYEIAEEFAQDEGDEFTVYRLSKRLEDWFEEDYLHDEHPYRQLNDVVADLCRLDRVEWYAIAENLASDLEVPVANNLGASEDEIDPHWSHRDED